MLVAIGQTEITFTNGTLRIFTKIGDAGIGVSIRRYTQTGSIYLSVDIEGKKVLNECFEVKHDTAPSS